MHILCLTCYVHLCEEISLGGVQAVATRWTTHCTLGVYVHLSRRLGIAQSAVVACDAVLGMCATMATVDGVVELHNGSGFRFIILFHDAK